MSPSVILFCLLGYFLGIMAIAWFTTSRSKSDLNTFFTANRSAKWYVVTFGMVGVTISGVTLISVPGEVGTKGMVYFQIVLGYFVGYWVISRILLPLYYRLKLPSIYSYLEDRFGKLTYFSGASFFLISRLLGTSVRFFLMIRVLQHLALESLQIPFEFIAIVAVSLIYLYTAKGGLQTILYTDLLQTFFILAAMFSVLITVVIDLSSGELWKTLWNSPYGKMISTDITQPNYFWKQFLAGMFITITMTGLDQDLMQKNLTCKTVGEAQKNMITFSFVILVVNILFLLFGAFLYLYVDKYQIPIPNNSDFLVPDLIVNHFSPVIALIFLLGVIAATYATSDSALTALTTSFCIDILKIRDFTSTPSIRKKNWVHLGITVVFLAVIIGLYQYEKNSTSKQSVISMILTLAGFSYGPLLGLYAFGLFSKIRIHDLASFLASVSAPIASLIAYFHSELWFGYQFGFEILLFNGFLTIIFMRIFNLLFKKNPNYS